MIAMDDSVIISIGGISSIIRSDKEFIVQIKKFFENFIADENNPSISINVKVISMESWKKFDTESPDVTIDELGGVCKVIWRNMYGEFNLQSNEGILKCSHPINLANFIRIIYSIILLGKQGFLVHASSLIKNGKGYLFPGKSGAGKTTITQLSPDSILLTDEVSLVKMVDGKFNIFGTPFWGDLAVGGENTSVPIEAVFFPIQDKRNYVNPIGPSQVLQKLLPNVLFFINQPEYRLKLFNLCNEFINDIPASELHFLPEPTFWRLIDVG